MTEMSRGILILDDEIPIQKMLSNYFEDMGYQVFSFGNGEDALNILETTNILVCIVDIRLPGMDGNEFIERAQKINSDLIFLIHTGSTEYHLPEGLLELGILPEHVFQKPLLDMGDLEKAIQKIITQREGEHGKK